MNVGDPDTNGGTLAFPKNAAGDQDDYAIKATAKLVVPSAGNYLIGFNSDDGAYVKIAGQTFTSITVNATGASAIGDPPEQVTCDCLTGDSNTRAEITLAAGTYDIEAGMFERAADHSLPCAERSRPPRSCRCSRKMVPGRSPYRKAG